MKIYILEIAYNDETDEIEYISESLDGPTGVTQEMILECEEYWDEDTMEVMRDSYSSGKT